eukprot:5946268-Pyramimonas_sp.AAC.1
MLVPRSSTRDVQSAMFDPCTSVVDPRCRSAMLHPRCYPVYCSAAVNPRSPMWVLRSSMHHLRKTPIWSQYDLKVIPKRNDLNAASQ